MIRSLTLSVCSLSLFAQAQQQQALTLNQAVEQALKNYPSIRASTEDAAAASAGIRLARTAYLPRAEVLGQINRATHNNIFGLMLPQSVVSPISGPVLGTNSLSSVWGSAAGVLVSWEPFDFGLRAAQVRTAASTERRVEASVAVSRLEVAAGAADAYLTLLAAEQTVRAARAAVERGRVLNRSVEALVSAQLRPGAEGTRARAELAAAETQLIQAEESASVARAGLSQFLRIDPAAIQATPGPLLDLPPEGPLPETAGASHPLALRQNAAVEEVKARERALERSYYPRFDLQASSYARGTGVRPDGSTGGAFSGAGPNIQNWAVGMTIRFPLLELPSLRARREAELHSERAEAARYDRVLTDLEGQKRKSVAALDGAWRVARNTPIQLDAARAAESQASARYRAGLGTIIEVADAQRLLTQAEIDDSIARLQVWRAMLGLAAAQGDVAPFLDRVK